MVCEKCGATMLEDWPNCMDCGAAVSGPAPRLQGAETDLFPKLAAANLNRIRANYAEAERLCAEILRAHPNSAAAHSLMGEISEDQGHYRDAIHWYQLALELDPTNEKDRGLLARAMQRQTAAERKNSATTRPGGKLQQLRTWVDLNPYGMITAGLALLCVGLLVYLVLALHHRGSGESGGGTTVGASASTTGSTVARANAAPGETPMEQALRQAVVSSLPVGGPPVTVDTVMIDPRMTSYARITATLSQPLVSDESRGVLLRAAAALGHGAGGAKLGMATLRIIGSVGASGPTLLFVGDVTTSAVANIDPDSVTPDSAASIFDHTWFSRYVP